MQQTDKEKEAMRLAMRGRAKMNKLLASKEKELEEIRKSPYCPFLSKEGYDLAVKAGWPNDMNWISKAAAQERERRGEKPKEEPRKPQKLIKF